MRRLAILAVVCACASALNVADAQTPAAAPAKAAPAAAAASTPSGAAPAAGGAGQSLGGDGPIDVTSDGFDRVALDHLIAHGNVEAIQGIARLRSPKIDIFYAQRTGEHAATPGGDVGHIQRMEAEGPVYYVTPTQTAKGDHGTYIAADDSITLTGHVILTQGQNVSTGEKLVIHQKTNQATLTAAPGQRVRAMLYPNQPAAPGQPGAAPAKPTAATKPAKSSAAPAKTPPHS